MLALLPEQGDAAPTTLCLLPISKAARVTWGAMGLSEALQPAYTLPCMGVHLGRGGDAFTLEFLLQLLSHRGLLFFSLVWEPPEVKKQGHPRRKL